MEQQSETLNLENTRSPAHRTEHILCNFLEKYDSDIKSKENSIEELKNQRNQLLQERADSKKNLQKFFEISSIDWIDTFARIKENESPKNWELVCEQMRQLPKDWYLYFDSILEYFLSKLSGTNILKVLKIIIDNGFNLNSYEGSKFILKACETGKLEAVKLLLPRALNGVFKINEVHESVMEEDERKYWNHYIAFQDSLIHDPLSAACVQNRFEIAKLLLSHHEKLGIKLDKRYESRLRLKNDFDETILSLTAKFGLWKIVELILKASVASGKVYGATTAMKRAMSLQDMDLIQLFIRYSKDIPGLVPIIIEKRNIHMLPVHRCEFEQKGCSLRKKNIEIKKVIKEFIASLSHNQPNERSENEFEVNEGGENIENEADESDNLNVQVKTEIKSEVVDIDENLSVSFEEENYSWKRRRFQ